MRVSHHPEGKISEWAVMREVGMGLDQSSPKSALVINNVALLVALVGGYHQLSWIISGNSIPNTAILNGFLFLRQLNLLIYCFIQVPN
jgi:hypothetical protein